MKKWLKNFFLISVISIIVLLLILFLNSNKFSNDYVHITDVNYQAKVIDEEFSNGKVIIKEQLTFDIHAASKDNLFWELWRELPEAYYDGVLVDYNVLSVKQILDDGIIIEMPESPQLYWYDEDFTDTSGELGPGKWYHSKGPYDNYYNYESLIFYVDGIYRDTIVYEIEYEMYNAALRYNDVSELYLAMYSGETIEHLKHFSGEILIPLDIMPKEGNYKAYTYGTHKHEFNFIESETINENYHTFKFDLNKDDLKFDNYNQYIEFALLSFNEDKHIFTRNASINNYYYDDMLNSIIKAQDEYEAIPQKYFNKKKTLFISLTSLGFGILLLALISEKILKNKTKLYTPTIEIDYFRDIPSDTDPNFVRNLVFRNDTKVHDSDGYASALLSLIHKGYISLTQVDTNKRSSPSNQLLEVLDSDVNLSTIETQYLNLIKRHASNSTITLDSLQNRIKKDYEYTEDFTKRVENSLKKYGVTEGYYQNSNYLSISNTLKSFSIILLVIAFVIMFVGNLSIFNTRMNLAFGSYFVLGFLLILTSLFLYYVSSKYVLLTQFGQDEYQKWHGLYKFLDNETLMVERGVKDLVIWEKYLIYATAFGISHKVIKALKMVFPKEVIQNSTLYYSSQVTRNNSFYNYSRSLSSSTKTATYTSKSGGHAGYGSSGRGGGGGGGGH
ncbi:MAG: DUF2207 domain-containing protein [Erysipelotrichaceae bacterium]|nr:DUF2207 domain-containing protein [Erysipelotrichaceae bacterium]